MTLRLDERDPASSLENELVGVDAFVLGPGLGRDAVAARFAKVVLERSEPVVVDADALHLVREDLADVCQAGPRVLTPHPGEAAALLGVTTKDVEADRFGAAQRLADLSGAVVVLKGSRSLIASPGSALWVCPFGAPVLATGGTGDVLGGVAAACLVHAKPLRAAALAVALHALAGERCARGGSASNAASSAGPRGASLDRGVLAHEIADAVPGVVAQLLAPSEDA
jgi:NAD(P)H-hydrate epimerase